MHFFLFQWLKIKTIRNIFDNERRPNRCHQSNIKYAECIRKEEFCFCFWLDVAYLPYSVIGHCSLDQMDSIGNQVSSCHSIHVFVEISKYIINKCLLFFFSLLPFLVLFNNIIRINRCTVAINVTDSNTIAKTNYTLWW